MKNVYYTAKEGKTGVNGQTITRGNIFIIRRGSKTTPHGKDGLELIGEYKHQSGGADIYRTLLDVCKAAGVNVGGGYYGRDWREFVNFIEV